MSQVANLISAPIKAASELVGSLTGGAKKEAPQDTSRFANPDVAARGEDFALREQVLGQRAAAAGATRSDNDADLLGFTAPRRKGAARAILG